MEVEEQYSSKKVKIDKGKEIVDLEKEEFIELPKVFIEKETEHALSFLVQKKLEEVFTCEQYSNSKAKKTQHRKKNELMSKYINVREVTLDESKKLCHELRKLSQ